MLRTIKNFEIDIFFTISYSDFGWNAPITYFGRRCNWCVRLVEWCNSLPVSGFGVVHHTDVRKVAPNLLEPVSLMFSWDAEKQRVRRDINFVASVWFRVWIHLMLQTLWNFYLTNWKKEIYLIYQKMLQNIRNSLVDCSQA